MESAPWELELVVDGLIHLIPVVALVVIFWTALCNVLLGDDREIDG
jgi:hypothetical protein